MHPVVSEEGSRESTDAKCMRLTAPWVRERRDEEGVERCGWYDGLEADGGTAEEVAWLKEACTPLATASA